MDRCPSCGSKSPDGRSGCRALFDQLLAREFSDYRYMHVHRMNVDSYSLQHPDEYCASAKSLIAHLCGLCCAMEYPDNPELLAGLRSSLDGNIQILKPSPPEFRGELTIEDLIHCVDYEAYVSAAKNWATSVWQAYSPLHAFAREWLQRYLGGAIGTLNKSAKG